jgi:transposase
MASTVIVNGKNGKKYVYENISLWDKQEKKTKHKRKCIGHIDPVSGDVVPNHKKTAGAKMQQCSVKGAGVPMLLERISSGIGLDKVLKATFDEDYKQILTCAYYLISEGAALSRVEQWSAANLTPYQGALINQRVSELLVRITGEKQMRFFSRWIRQNHSDEYYAMDITSVSSYSEGINFVRYGYNRDKEKLPQINLLMASGEKSRLPMYFRVLPGSINDVSTLRNTLEILEVLDTKQLHLVMDKGFYSQVNIDELYEGRMKFTVGVPFKVGFANDLVRKARAEKIFSHENYRRIFDEDIYVKSELHKWNGHRCYWHVYYDSLKVSLENKKFDRVLYDCFQELQAGNENAVHKVYYEKFFHVKQTPKRGRKVEYNQQAIDNHRENTIGWFVLISNDIKDPVKALEVYRLKDSAEKNFDDLKNDLDGRRLRIHSDQAMEGRLFIQFIALILSSRIKQIMHEAGWFKNHDMQQVIDEMKSLREIRTSDSRKRVISTPTAMQEKIIKLFGIAI